MWLALLVYTMGGASLGLLAGYFWGYGHGFRAARKHYFDGLLGDVRQGLGVTRNMRHYC